MSRDRLRFIISVLVIALAFWAVSSQLTKLNNVIHRLGKTTAEIKVQNEKLSSVIKTQTETLATTCKRQIKNKIYSDAIIDALPISPQGKKNLKAKELPVPEKCLKTVRKK